MALGTGSDGNGGARGAARLGGMREMSMNRGGKVRDGLSCLDVTGNEEEADKEDQPQCRICLESDGRDLIAPCRCKGSARFVHRHCLDQWRATKEGFAFCHCSTCKARFQLRVCLPPDLRCRHLKFRFFVAKDIVLVTLLVQMEGFAFCHCSTCKARFQLHVCLPPDLRCRHLKFRFFVARDIVLVTLLVQMVSFSSVPLSKRLPQRALSCTTPWPVPYQDEVSPLFYPSPLLYFLRNHQLIICFGYTAYVADYYWFDMGFQKTWASQSPATFYYICGVLFFLVSAGLLGAIMTCVDRRFRSDLAAPCRDLGACCCDPLVCGSCDCHVAPICLYSDCSGCSFCFSGCSDCAAAIGGCSGEAGLFILLTVGAILLVVLALVGVLYCLLVSTLVVQRIWQRHYHVLAKRILTKEFIVEDLSGMSLPPDWSPPPLLPEHEKQLRDLRLL
ncbi:unnamed protein product [Closterium sp. Yama58-4]|nr:unnamed protein product [Closterium sp. Yama58-4]